MSEVLTPFILQMGTGVTGGFLVGYAIKKIVKIVTVVLGFGFLSLLYLSHLNMITVNYEEFMSRIAAFFTEAIGFLSTTIPQLSLASSFFVGFALGIKKG